MPTKPSMIVAEISKNWAKDGTDMGTPLLSQKFETVIRAHQKSGFRLHSWKLNSLAMPNGNLNETIIAVFEDDHAN